MDEYNKFLNETFCKSFCGSNYKNRCGGIPCQNARIAFEHKKAKEAGISAVSNIKAKWYVEEGEGYVCGNCKHFDSDHLNPYCPVCGAEMDCETLPFVEYDDDGNKIFN